MKVCAIKQKNQPNILKKLKSYLSNTKIKLKGFLERDTFEKKQNLLKSRGYPNAVGGDNENIYGGKSGRVKFFVEDVKKMKNMTIEERLAFKEKLIDESRYTE